MRQLQVPIAWKEPHSLGDNTRSSGTLENPPLTDIEQAHLNPWLYIYVLVPCPLALGWLSVCCLSVHEPAQLHQPLYTCVHSSSWTGEESTDHSVISKLGMCYSVCNTKICLTNCSAWHMHLYTAASCMNKAKHSASGQTRNQQIVQGGLNMLVLISKWTWIFISL